MDKYEEKNNVYLRFTAVNKHIQSNKFLMLLSENNIFKNFN